VSRRTAPKRPVHPWQADPGVTDWRGQPLCTCGQPQNASTHQLPDNPAAAEEARRLGEHPEREDDTDG
jgi:hypothetical protein